MVIKWTNLQKILREMINGNTPTMSMRTRLTKELVAWPKKFVRPVSLMDNDPKESTTSPPCSSEPLSERPSRCMGALIRSSSSASKGCGVVEFWVWEARRPSSSSLTRVESSRIFSWRSWVEARTNLVALAGVEMLSTRTRRVTHRLPLPVVKDPLRRGC